MTPATRGGGGTDPDLHEPAHTRIGTIQGYVLWAVMYTGNVTDTYVQPSHGVATSTHRGGDVALVIGGKMAP